MSDAKHDTAQLAQALGPALHLVDDAQTTILVHCPEVSTEQTKAVRRVLLHLAKDSYESGSARGEAVAAHRLGLLMKDVGLAWSTALRKLFNQPAYAFPVPTLAAVAAEVRARGVVATDAEVARLCAAVALPYTTEGA